MRPRHDRSKLRRWFALSSGDRQRLLEAWWRLFVAAWRLRFAPRRAVAAALVESKPLRNAHDDGASSAQAALAVARAAAHHLRPMTCLPRALALQRMLARRGIASRMRIGVSKAAGGSAAVAAHAWIEVDGVPVGEPQAIEERFLPLLEAGKPS